MFPHFYEMDSSVFPTISVDLLNVQLWETFHVKTNEMIITKSGRRMFPVVKLRIRGLEARSIYSIELEFVRTSRSRMKFADGVWRNGSENEESVASARWRHPESPNYGYHWMSSEVSFAKIKITNKADNKNCVALSSLYKYHVRVIILKLDDDIKTTEKVVKTESFPVTEFIAVTSYQNSEVTQLKIQYNPFAKAFQQPRNILPCPVNETNCPSQNQEKQNGSGNTVFNQALVNRMMTPRGEFSSCRSQTATSSMSASCFPSPLYGFQDNDLMRLRHQQSTMAIGTSSLNTRFEDIYPQYFRMMDDQSRHTSSPWSSCSRISSTPSVIDHQASAISYSSGNSSILHSPFATYPPSRRTQTAETEQQPVLPSGMNQWNPFLQHVNLGSNTFPMTNSPVTNSTEERKMEIPLPLMETNCAQNSSPLSVSETAWSSESSSPNCTYQTNGVQSFF